MCRIPVRSVRPRSVAWPAIERGSRGPRRRDPHSHRRGVSAVRTTGRTNLDGIGRPGNSLVRMAFMRDDSEVCPYQGLAPFEAGETELFFGRTQATRGLLDRLA